MRTFRYSTKFPTGKIFDTEPGNPDPYPCPKHKQTVDGVVWYDSPAFLTMTTDEVVEAAVKEEIAKNSDLRPEMDKEHLKLHGHEPRLTTPDKKVEAALGEPGKKRRKKKK